MISKEHVDAACDAYERVTGHIGYRDGMQAALVAAFGDGAAEVRQEALRMALGTMEHGYASDAAALIKVATAFELYILGFKELPASGDAP